jgi:hypothetical protein
MHLSCLNEESCKTFNEKPLYQKNCPVSFCIGALKRLLVQGANVQIIK